MAVRRGTRLKVPGTSVRGALRMACPIVGQERRHGVGQRAAAAQERRMNCRRSVCVEVAEAPRLALRVGGLKVVQQVLVVQVSQPRAVIRHPVGLARDEEVPLLVAVRPLVHQQQPKQVGCWRRR